MRQEVEEKRPRQQSTDRLKDKGTDELVAETTQIRSEMNSTLDAIERRLSTGEILDRLLNFLSANPGKYLNNFGRTIRENPIPAIMAGLGLSWLILAGIGNRPEAAAAGERWRRTFRYGQETGDPEKRRRKSTALAKHLGRRREKFGEFSAREARARPRETAIRLRDGLAYVLQEQPLVPAALGFAIGAMLGAVLPVSHVETEWLAGEKGFRRQTKGTTHEQVQRVAEAAEAAIESTREQAEGRLH